MMRTLFRAELGDSSLDPDADAWVIDNEDGSVAEIQCPADEQEATARFIVKACNAHDALVAALKEALNAMLMQEQRETEAFHLSNKAFRPVWDKAKADTVAALRLIEKDYAHELYEEANQ